MSLLINTLCINCDVCAPACPNTAISQGETIYEIDPNLCTECVGHFDEPQCVQVCPVECIPVDPAHVEQHETLWQKYQRLQAAGLGPGGLQSQERDLVARRRRQPCLQRALVVRRPVSRVAAHQPVSRLLFNPLAVGHVRRPRP